MTEVIIPGGVKAATPYEYQAYDRRRRFERNDILVWMDEQERDTNGRCCTDPENGP